MPISKVICDVKCVPGRRVFRVNVWQKSKICKLFATLSVLIHSHKTILSSTHFATQIAFYMRLFDEICFLLLFFSSSKSGRRVPHRRLVPPHHQPGRVGRPGTQVHLLPERAGPVRLHTSRRHPGVRVCQRLQRQGQGHSEIPHGH